MRFVSDHGRAHEGEHFDIRTATMFCVGMRRDVWERVGPLDERFEVGMSEDEDYAMRVRAAGCRVVCAEDSFVHHFGQASLGKLAATGDYGPLFHANRQRWEAKWGHTWEPYRHRPITSYQTMVERVRELVHDAVPRNAAILVASKGDDQFLQFEGRRASHFPQTADGAYPGHHPADSAAAICHLEERGTGPVARPPLPQAQVFSCISHCQTTGNVPGLPGRTGPAAARHSRARVPHVYRLSRAGTRLLGSLWGPVGAAARVAEQAFGKLLTPHSGKPWKNGIDESFNGKFRDEYLSPAVASKSRRRPGGTVKSRFEPTGSAADASTGYPQQL